jgi:uncharacterized protein (DUF58 family)
VTVRWRPTDALLRAALASLTFALVAVLTGRADLLVLAVPLLVATGAAVVRRPRATPRAETRLLHSAVREGEGTTLRTTLHDAEAVEQVSLRMSPHRWVAWKPATGVRGASLLRPADQVHVDVPVASLRWGRRLLGDGQVAATTRWAGFRWGPEPLLAQTLTVLPLPGRFDSRAPTPHPIGLVGTNPARREGDGTELASVRPFQPGDRLRRVHWPVSLRAGRLHVTSTVAEQDSSILLVVDSGLEIGGRTDGEDATSSLDIAVRAAGAIAEHYLHRGDRVGLRVLGSTRHNAVRTGAGRRHLRRILDTLAGIVPGENRDADPARMHFGISGGTVVIMLSPMLSAQAVSATLTLARRGVDVVVVDTLPDDPFGDTADHRLRIAWRMRLLEREAPLGRLRRAGVPVVAWRGPGTLDEVLRRLGRRAARPQAVGR